MAMMYFYDDKDVSVPCDQYIQQSNYQDCKTENDHYPIVSDQTLIFIEPLGDKHELLQEEGWSTTDNTVIF